MGKVESGWRAKPGWKLQAILAQFVWSAVGCHARMSSHAGQAKAVARQSAPTGEFDGAPPQVSILVRRYLSGQWDVCVQVHSPYVYCFIRRN